MREIVSFYTTTCAFPIVNVFLTLGNIVCIVLAGFFLYRFLLRVLRRLDVLQQGLNGKGRYVLVPAACFMLYTICMLYIQGGQLQSAQTGQSAWYYFLQMLRMLLEPILNISAMAVSPIPVLNLTGVNLLARVGLLYLYAYMIHKAYAFAWKTDRDFGGFLNAKVYAEGSETDGAENGTPALKPASGTGASGQKRVLLPDALVSLISSTGIVGSLLAYILGGEDARNAIKEVLETVQAVLNTITLTSNLTLDVPGAVVFITNFLYIVLSICILAVYAAIISAMMIFIAAAWKNRDKIMGWVTRKGPLLFLCGGVAGLILLACMVVFLTGSGFDAVKSIFTGMFQSRDVFDTVARFILLVLCICVAVLMVGFVIVFSFFVAYLGIQIGKRSWEQLKYSRNVLVYAQILAVVIIGAGALLGIGYGYQSLSKGLGLLFPWTPGPRMSLLWVTGHIFLLVLIVLGTLLAALMLIKTAISSMARLLMGRPDRVTERFLSLIRSLLEQIIQFLYLVPLLLKHTASALQNLIRTLLQIFIGFSTESDKNRAIFVAACFASLASLLNTYFGLIDFYSDQASVIPVVCSLAIACAVQLAMLIFGMKAGEGIAEKIMMGVKPQKRSPLWVGTVKVCTIIACLSLLAYGWQIARSWGGSGASDPSAVLPISLMILSAAVLLAVVLRQALDLIALWRAFWEKRKAAGSPQARQFSSMERERNLFRILGRGTKRLPPWFYLTAYLLLMVVSTGFAFNNLFGYYADQADLHEQIYDQAADQAEEELRLNQRISDLVGRYNQNTNQLITILEQRAAAASKKLAADMARLDENVTSSNLDYRAQNLRNRHAGDTRNFADLVEALKNYIEMDADSVGDDAVIETYKYAHYWGGNEQPSYETICIVIRIGQRTDCIGQLVTPTSKQSVTITVGETDYTFTLHDRIVDPDSDTQSIAQTCRTQTEMNKYKIVEALLSLFDSQEQIILDYDVEKTIGSGGGNSSVLASSGGGTEQASALMRQYLNQNSILDGVRGNLVKLCKGDDSKEKVTIQDLPNLVVKYLNPDSGDDNAEDSGDKLTAYQQLSAHIDRMLSVHDILAVADTVLDNPIEPQEGSGASGRLIAFTTASAAENPQTDPARDTSAYTVRLYRSYAQGIAHSNFQISYDALFRGGFGLNPNRDKMDALYRSSIIAAFLLLICLLVDLMAFFGGLLLFKEIFLFERNKKLEELGYLNYEALLTNLFTPPQGDPIRLLHLALIYRLLYGDPYLDHADQPDAMGKMEKLHNILNSKDFQALYDETWDVLGQLDIDQSNLPELQQWLMDFVQRNGIDFDEPFV